MRPSTKICSLLFVSLLLCVFVYAGSIVDVSTQWEMKLKYRVSGSFSTAGNPGVTGSYQYNGVLKGAIGLDDDRDFMYYYEKGDVKAFQLDCSDTRKGRRVVSDNKKLVKKEIEFIIRNGRDVYIEFHTEPIVLSKLVEATKLEIPLPRSYGILKRKANRKYRKGIKKGGNRICFKEKDLYTKMQFKKKYNWRWERETRKLRASHQVDIELYIKIK